jgi:glucosamine kinase
MIFLLAESGGTKTQWYLYDRDGLQKSIRTSGMNPNTATAEAIATQQREEWGADLPSGEGLTLDFYGAGLGAPATEATMRGILEGLFPGANIRIESDMLAAARAGCGDQPGIVCILGTGSNCCYWDGQKITANLGSHGYLFNDEGSGADLGRTLLSALLSGEMPHQVEHLFKDWSGGKKLLDIRTEIYQAPKVNVALAEYSRFIAAHLDNAAVRYLAIGRFSAFLTRHVMRMSGHRELPIHFVGSVAHVYAEPLAETLQMLQLTAGTITAAPGDALLAYHVQQLQSADASAQTEA